MLVFVYRLLARLPLAWVQWLGALLGLLVFLLPGRYRTRLKAHAAQAGYPQPAFARRCAAHLGAGMLELSWVWFRPAAALRRVEVADPDLLADLGRHDTPVIFLTPHLGCYEVAARFVSQTVPMTVLFRAPRQRQLAELLEAARATAQLQTAPANLQGVRALLRALRAGGAIGILPDQVPAAGEGVWAPFFGREAYTMTLAGRLARQPDVRVVAVSCVRQGWGKGWRLHLDPLPPPPETPEAQAVWLNTAMEAVIRRDPVQYLWSYHRYKQP